MKTVWCIPSNVETNKYMFLMKKAIKQAGYKVLGKGEKLNKICADIVHLNWFEDVPQNDKYRKVYLKKLALLYLFKISGKKIVYTMHNKQPHDGSNIKYSEKLMDKIIHFADAIVIHSKYSNQIINIKYKDIINEKIFYVPLPNYDNAYQDEIQYSGYQKKKGDLVFGFLGQVRPYKNVETLIKAANMLIDENDVKFLICGKCLNEEYKSQVEKLISNKNINLDLRFISDGEVPSLLSVVDVLILPYSTNSALNSAAAVLAFSYGKTVISTNVGTVLDLGESDDIFVYEYTENEKEHTERLANEMRKVIDVYRKASGDIAINGYNLKIKMLKENSIFIVGEAIKKTYNSLFAKF